MSTDTHRAAKARHQRGRWTTAGVAFAMLAVQMFAGTAMAQRLAPLVNERVPNRIPGQYIVVFKTEAQRTAVSSAQDRVRSLGGKVTHNYFAAVKGFSASLSDSAVQTLRAMPDVAYIEVDQVGSLNTEQFGPPAGLDRTSERLGLDNRYTYSETGAGVHVYVIDTGIRPTHTEFLDPATGLSRVSGGVNTMNAMAGTDDCHGHGTHVAGTVGGTTFGIAKRALLHPVRAGDCSNTYLAPVIAAVDWVTMNRVLPAVANLSSGFNISPTLDTAIANSVAADVTYAVAAGNNNGDACNISPARAPLAITVGAIDPANDTRTWFSNFGTCVDLFAPGLDTLSAGIANDTSTDVMSGTSMASPHVAGVAARYLETHPAATPAAVWAALHTANNVFPVTAGWAGVIDRGAGSPNEQLHYGSLNDGVDDGDPHITTVNGVYYDFQAGGEFVALREANGMQVQTRQTPVASAPWVSVNTAVAARVGKHRVTWQPSLGGEPDPNGMQLRLNGKLTSLGSAWMDLGAGGRMRKPDANTLEVDFPDGSTLFASSNWWSGQNQWYLNVRVFHTPAKEGIMGVVRDNEWTDPKFVAKWRVTDRTSLFDYAPGTSTKNFTWPIFPAEKIPPMKPENVELAKEVCRAINDERVRKGCLFDVGTTGDPIFAETSKASQRMKQGATRTSLTMDAAAVSTKGSMTFVATVKPHARKASVPVGTVRFLLDGRAIGHPIPLDRTGRAMWTASPSVVGDRQVTVEYLPTRSTVFLPSVSDGRRFAPAKVQANPLTDPGYRQRK